MAAVGLARARSGGTTAPSALPAASGTGGAAPPPACPSVTSAAATGTASTPVLWWRFGEGAGSIACDASGSGNAATLSAAAGWRPGSPGALQLTSGGYAAGSAPAVRTDRSFTVMAWVYLTDKRAPHGVLSQPGEVSSGFVLEYEKPADSWRLIMPRSDSAGPEVDGPSSASPPALNTWTHLAGRYDADRGTITLFVDGTADESVPHASAWAAAGPIQAGRTWYDGAWTDRFAGSIKDVRAYPQALSTAEIATIARDTRPA
ncbi:hypothetical protein GCM10010168_86440 [Actinoplanes ianthinogenes]|uniref:LamG-like jellyroll fold domain-containing protein n=1 Tax=Actinoplanes ianthinogenes TaxID=122358 RepID=A0ABM7M1D2_9ACTN|nr:LamG domain-containing protein [Actinoplanes ianthinogenes]BCJ45375.1 hypothetical protein Aiant_60320 [Actinoplanes ianthinogenes]GGR54084.1 hypothetical protein GCM10010168_86440 [Actinoplanes ianthinogenes]